MTIIDRPILETWTAACRFEELIPDRGVAVLVDGRAVALFRLSGTDELVAIDNVDPFAGVSVLSRGIVGSVEIDGAWRTYVASPLRKQRFDLRTGVCLDDAEVELDVFDTMVDDGVVVVRSMGARLGSRDPETGSRWSNVDETPS